MVNIKNRVYIVCRNILSTACTHDLFVYRFPRIFRTSGPCCLGMKHEALEF